MEGQGVALSPFSSLLLPVASVERSHLFAPSCYLWHYLPRYLFLHVKTTDTYFQREREGGREKGSNHTHTHTHSGDLGPCQPSCWLLENFPFQMGILHTFSMGIHIQGGNSRGDVGSRGKSARARRSQQEGRCGGFVALRLASTEGMACVFAFTLNNQSAYLTELGHMHNIFKSGCG